jgi:hypothetical protein
VVLSTRSSADAWWKSANDTIFQITQRPVPEGDDPDLMILRAQMAMATEMLRLRFTPDGTDAEAAKAAYEAHNAEVRAAIPPARLVDWQPGDGWAPICAALGLDEPATPFPHVNSTDDFRAMVGMDPID